MKETTVFQEEEPHRLSFRDLPNQPTIPNPPPTSTRPDLLFSFSAAPSTAAHSYFNDIIFCGKIIHDDDDQNSDQENDLNEYQKRDYFATVKSHSLRRPSDNYSDDRRIELRHKSSDVEYHAQRVNITALTSMSAKSRRRMFMFGMVKFKPEMELSAIKKRQGKMSPAVREKAVEGGGKGRWGVLKASLRGRSHFSSVLVRSLGCFPVGGERRLGAAN